MRKLITAILFVLTMLTASAQNSSQNKKAVQMFDMALSRYGAELYDECLSLCDKALKLDNKFIEVYWLKAEVAIKRGNKSAEIQYLNEALKVQPDNATTICGLGDAFFDDYQNDSALVYYNRLMKLERAEQKLVQRAQNNMEQAKFRIHAMKNPLDIKPENLGPLINTQYNEYFPSLSADGNTLVYTIEVPQTSHNPLLPSTQEDIYISRRIEGKPWQQARSIGATINTHNNEGAPFLSADGKMLFLTSCTCPDGMIKCCDIYYSYYKNGEFTYPRALPQPVNSGAWESQPTFSADNTTLFFVSNRQGGIGGKDIWFSRLEGNGRWSEPENCGPNINTPDDEMSPFIHADGKTLYFSSNGRIGMGGHDLYVSHLQDDGTWGPAQNLGYPINTRDNENRLAVSVFGNTAIISSDRDGSGNLDLYQINLPPSIRPNRTLYVAGTVKDRATDKPIRSLFELVSLQDGKTIQSGETYDVDIENLMLYLPEGQDYALTIRADGYLMNSLNFSLKNIPDSVTKKSIVIPMDKPAIGTTVTLSNIFFETDKYDLKPESFYELNKLVKFLQDNPSLRIEIGGHTDNAGSEAHNQELSSNRAKAIVDYLISQNIASSRLSAKGYGSTKPCAPNDTKENMAKNRRTEFKIID